MTPTELQHYLWKIAELLRDDFKRGKYADVVLPFTVLRRLDCVLDATKQKVLDTHKKYKGKVDNLHSKLCHTSGYPFYNTSKFDFKTLLEDPANLRQNLATYINGFSENVRQILEKFDFPKMLDQLESANLLYLVTEQFAEADLRPEMVDNYQMGTVFEELIRRFNEMLDENPGEHFTPREVVRLMVKLAVAPDMDRIRQRSRLCHVYDPACGTGGMLAIARDVIEEIEPSARVALFGQEVNPETWAVCKADMLIKTDPRDVLKPDIYLGSTLSDDGFEDKSFDYMLCNPPYGKDWKKDKSAVSREHDTGDAGRFGAGLPRISDGQLLFLQTMISKMRPTNGEYSRIAIIMNGSPLFTGDAGSGESEIRRWMFENDWVEAIIALPDQMFYNTGINTYVWVLSNKKKPDRIGKVQLIDARDLCEKMRRSLGDKRKELSDDNITQILQLYEDFEPGECSQIFDTTDFAYRKVRVERPLRLNFQATPERIERLWDQTAFQNLDKSRKRKDKQAAMLERKVGAEEQQLILDALEKLDSTRVWKNRGEFLKEVRSALKRSGAPTTAAITKAIWKALGEHDETADICLDAKGNPEPDPDLRDYENVPYREDVWEYFEREVKPHVPDARVDEEYQDDKDGEIGKVGYEINFNRYFYKYTPPRPLGEIEADIKALEMEILEMLKEVTA